MPAFDGFRRPPGGSPARAVLALTLVAAAALGACSTSQPPVAATLGSTAAGQAKPDWTRAAPVADATAWWRQLQDATLRGWIETALQDNAEVRQAAARTAALRQAETATQSRLLPQAQVQVAASQTETGLPETIKRAGQPDNRAVRGTVDLAWELDLFGAARAAGRAAQGEAVAAAHQQQAAAQLVAAEVTRQALLWQAAHQRHAWLQALLAEQEQQFALQKLRHAQGLISAAEQARLEADLADTRSQAQAAWPQVEAARARLNTLLHRPLGAPALATEAPSGAALPVLPGLRGRPSLEVLRQRPDVQAAEAQLQAEGARWDETRAQLWPRILLGASLGAQDLRLNALDLAPSVYRNVVAAFTLPVFNSGRLRAQRDAQGARTAAAQLQWEKTMLTAVEEVEASLALQAQQRERARQTEQALALRLKQHEAVQALGREGLVDGVVLRDSRRAVLAARLQHLEAQTQSALADLQLLRATGGAGTSATTAP